MTETSLNRQKTLWEKEKLLVTRNFSFSHSVFKRLVLQTCKNQSLFGKGLTVLQTTKILGQSKMEVSTDDKINVSEKLKFLSERVETLWEKGKIFPRCFQRASFLGLSGLLSNELNNTFHLSSAKNMNVDDNEIRWLVKS